MDEGGSGAFSAGEIPLSHCNIGIRSYYDTASVPIVLGSVLPYKYRRLESALNIKNICMNFAKPPSMFKSNLSHTSKASCRL